MTVTRNTILEDGVTRKDLLTLVPSACVLLGNLGGKGQTDAVQLARGADPPGLHWHGVERSYNQSTDKSLGTGGAYFLGACPGAGRVFSLTYRSEHWISKQSADVWSKSGENHLHFGTTWALKQNWASDIEQASLFSS